MYTSDLKTSFKGASPLASALNTYYNPNAILPILMIESGVTIGRSVMAAKRGGKMEASERLVEQGTSAIIWIWGVQALKKFGDFLGKKLFKLNLNFDVGFDYLRNPMKNNNISKIAKNYKIANMFASVAIATYFIGFILPKINHKISKKYMLEQNGSNPSQEMNQQKNKDFISMEEFLSKNRKNKDNNISFTAMNDVAFSLSHILENNQTARLLVTDTGVIAGRYKNSRNKYEKIESLFRDISSIYFYLFATKNFVNLANKITKNTDIDPKTLECVKEEILRHDNSDIHSFMKNAFTKLSEENAAKLDKLFANNKKIINVDDFISAFPSFREKAENMAKLQPIFNGRGVLSYNQAKTVLSTGWTTNPKFLYDTFSKATNGASADKLRYVSATKLDRIKNSILNFVSQVESYAKKKNVKIDKKLVETVANNNMKKNFAFYTAGTAVSIFVLSYLIPKIQYLITKKLTKEDKFPGACEYKK